MVGRDSSSGVCVFHGTSFPSGDNVGQRQVHMSYLIRAVGSSGHIRHPPRTSTVSIQKEHVCDGSIF